MTVLASKTARRESGLTVPELLAIIILLVVLANLSICGPAFPTHRAQMSQVLSNMRQLHLAAQTMVLDGTTTGETNLRWPGDADGSYSNLMKNLVPSYLSTNVASKLLAVPGRKLANNRIPKADEAAVRFYAVREKDHGTVVFLSTANFTNTPEGGAPLLPGSVPFGTNGFVVFRKGGDGSVLSAGQVGQTNVIGAYAPLCR